MHCGVRTAEFKLIKYYKGDDGDCLNDTTFGEDAWEMYFLAKDPEEKRNVANT